MLASYSAALLIAAAEFVEKREKTKCAVRYIYIYTFVFRDLVLAGPFEMFGERPHFQRPRPFFGTGTLFKTIRRIPNDHGM